MKTKTEFMDVLSCEWVECIIESIVKNLTRFMREINSTKGWKSSIVLCIFLFHSYESISSLKLIAVRCMFCFRRTCDESSMGLRCDEADCNVQSAGNKFFPSNACLLHSRRSCFLPYMITTIWKQKLSKESRSRIHAATAAFTFFTDPCLLVFLLRSFHTELGRRRALIEWKIGI